MAKLASVGPQIFSRPIRKRSSAPNNAFASALGPDNHEDFLLACIRRETIAEPLLQGVNAGRIVCPQLAQEPQPRGRAGASAAKL